MQSVIGLQTRMGAGSPIMFLGRNFGIIGRDGMFVIGRFGDGHKNGRRLNFHFAHSSYGT